MYRMILDNRGRPKARLQEGNHNPLQILDGNGRLVGTYNKSSDSTYDRSGRFVGKGDQRMTLV